MSNNVLTIQISQKTCGFSMYFMTMILVNPMYQNTQLFPTQASPHMDSICILQTHQTSMGLCPNLSTRHFVQLRQYIKPCIFSCQSNKGCYSHLSDLVFILKIHLSVGTWIWFFFFFLQNLSYWSHLWFSEFRFYFQHWDFWTFSIPSKFCLQKIVCFWVFFLIASPMLLVAMA